MRKEGKLRERHRKERLRDRDKEAEWERERDRERETEKERDTHTHTHREAQAHIKKQNNRIIEWYLPIVISLLILAFEPCGRIEEKPKNKKIKKRSYILYEFFFDKIEKISVSSYDKFK